MCVLQFTGHVVSRGVYTPEPIGQTQLAELLLSLLIPLPLPSERGAEYKAT